MTTKKASEKPQAGGFSLSKYNTEQAQTEGMWFQPHGPDGVLLDWKVLVAGQDSTFYADAMSEIAKLKSKKQMMTSEGSMDFHDIKDGEIIIAAYVTLDWEPLVDLDLDPTGELIKPIMPNKKKMMKLHRWLADQIITWSRKRGNFIKA